MDKDLCANYKAVLADQQANRERIVAELKAADAVIAALTAKIAAQDAEARAWSKPLPFPPVGLLPNNMIYAGISVRWAVLCLMAEHAKGPMRTVEMADALLAGGVRSGGQNFAANVSAVVSEMARKKGELSADDGKYQITDHGREVWDGIKHSRQYKYRHIETVQVDTPQAQEG